MTTAVTALPRRSSSRSRRLGAVRTLGSLAALGAGALGYALLEARLPVLRRCSVPVLADGEEPITILHLTDLHLTDRTEARVAWVRDLAAEHPDVVISTGDHLSFASGLEPLRRALEPFVELPGAFVLGDHDYYSSVFKPPTRYLRRDPRTADAEGARERLVELPWREVIELQASGGWADLTNARGTLTVRGRRVDLVGVDDPHAERDSYPVPDDGADGAASAALLPPILDRSGRALRLGLAHAPYLRVLNQMAGDGVALALAGHTHGGQLCLPGFGALVTNCDLDRRRVTQRLSQWPGHIGDPSAAGDMYLHVSAGLGTSPFTPVRVACRPEATLLTLVPAR
ncbi:metallophosphoesterase [Actinomyces marmotae]|uniref:Metallophosphoesterase n=1 Tax=Actinomyces marmotae TaxID=2737173 RepID=A0A6M8B2U0_9ACTO|nr:metallophosphoesterase [Actinomyces marmotae]QKD78980.1 metallophosphoesterase [Actinomyces marmotae]